MSQSSSLVPPSYRAPESLKLKGTYVVTGGNRGIGKAYSYALAQAGSNVAIIYRQSQDAPNVANAIQELCPNSTVRAYQCDVCDLEKLQETFKKIEKELGKTSGVIANAGISVLKPAMDLSHEDFFKVFGVNVFGVFNTCRAAAKLWTDRKQEGNIVITASMSAQIINQAARNTPLTQAFYNSSKAAVVNLTKGLAVEWAPHHIRVNSLSPGYVDTDQTTDMPKEVLRHQRENVPLRRFAEPRDIAPMALYLLSPSSCYATGSDHVIDGGQLIW